MASCHCYGDLENGESVLHQLATLTFLSGQIRLHFTLDRPIKMCGSLWESKDTA